MTTKRFERVTNSITPTPLVMGETIGTKHFERITNSITPTPMYLVPPDVLRLEVEFDAMTTARPMDVARKLMALSMAVDRLERSLGGEGMQVNELTQDGPVVKMALLPTMVDGATERLVQLRGAVERVMPSGIHTRRVG